MPRGIKAKTKAERIERRHRDVAAVKHLVGAEALVRHAAPARRGAERRGVDLDVLERGRV